MRRVLTSLAEAAQLVKDGDVVTTGGATFHRAPMELLREIVRQKRKELVLIDREPAIDFDLLIGAGCVAKVRAGLLAFELLGFAPNFRRKSQSREIVTKEGACQPIMAGFRAAAMGIPSITVRGMLGSDLLGISEMLGSQREVEDPFTGEKLIAVRAIEPDVALLHVHEADVYGNCRIEGPHYEDVIKAKAAKKVVVSAEEIVPTEELRKWPGETTIPHFLVDAVVEAPRGAHPCSCYSRYDADYDHIRAYMAAVNEGCFEQYLDENVYGRNVR